jgi:hypothetical protein
VNAGGNDGSHGSEGKVEDKAAVGDKAKPSTPSTSQKRSTLESASEKRKKRIQNPLGSSLSAEFFKNLNAKKDSVDVSDVNIDMHGAGSQSAGSTPQRPQTASAVEGLPTPPTPSRIIKFFTKDSAMEVCTVKRIC